jgi:hypothetical protein
MSQILPGLFLGDMENAKNKETLDFIKVKYILQVTNSCKPFFPEVSTSNIF